MSAPAWTRQQVIDLGVSTSIDVASSVLGIGRTTGRELYRRGEYPVPVLKLGRRYVIPVAHLLRLLGLDDHSGVIDGQTSATEGGTGDDQLT